MPRTFFLLLLIGTWTSVTVVGTIESLVEVFDGVLTETTRETLHQECKSWPNDDVVFVFPLAQPRRHSFIEQALNWILLQLYPDPKGPLFYVEYWKRQEWFHILAHADMDEGLRREQEQSGLYGEPFAHPETGHVLYLKLGKRVRGPTCVFNTTFGGDLVKQDATEMLVVPAVESRLLRFQGNLLHAVPRPADLWLAPTHEKVTEPFEEWGRSVLLFNTWPVSGGLLRERSITNESTSDLEFHSAECLPKEDWKEVGTEDLRDPLDSLPMVPIQFPLMGDEQRRGTAELSVILETSEAKSRKAFFSSHQPSRILLRPRKRRRKKSLLGLMGLEF